MKSCLLAAVCGYLLVIAVTPTRAAVVVYTDPVAWETAVIAVNGHFHAHNFESDPTGSLSAGPNVFPFFFDSSGTLTVDIPGSPGFNAIDDSFTADPFGNALSPNGSTYYLGDAFATPTLSFFDYPGFSVTGFGADWVIQGDLVIEVQGTLIPVGAYLPTGSGFLGIVTDVANETLVANLSGAFFGMDELRTGNVVPIPAAAWLFGSGLLGLVGIARRKAA